MKFVKKYHLELILILLLIPALFINLGLVSFIEDEGTRSIVSLEMILSGNYIAPTINGEFYFLKPPLYNWILVAFFKLTNNYSNFVVRLPAVISLILFAFTIYLSLKNKFGKKIAFLVSISFIICSRVLFYDSLHGLIDITFSWVIYTLFVSVYYFLKRNQYYLLFMVSYVLTAAGFLMKGLPAIAFLGITLLVVFIYTRQFKKLFSVAHFTAIVIFILLIGVYYYLYFKSNPDSGKNILTILFNEVEKKTVTNQIFRFIWHLFYFWVDFFLNFLPWSSFLLILLFSGEGTFLKPGIIFFYPIKIIGRLLSNFKNNVRWILKNEYLKYILTIFFSNILIYWLSPVVYPRYLLMFVPLFYTLMFVLYFIHLNNEHWLNKVYNFLLFVCILVMQISPLVYLLIDRTRSVDHSAIKVLVLFVLYLPVTFLFLKTHDKYRKILLIFIAVIILRIEFNLFILPVRYTEVWNVKAEKSAAEVGLITKNNPLYLYDTPSIFHEKNKKLRDLTVFYLTREREAIFYKDTTLQKKGFYLVPAHLYKKPGIRNKKIMKLYTGGTPHYLIEIK